MEPFISVPYKQYKNTFLQNVTVYHSFKCDRTYLQSKDFADKYEVFFCDNFGLTPQRSFLDGGVSITSSDKVVSFNFAPNAIYVKVGARSYRSFNDSVLPQALKLEQFLQKVLKVEHVTATAVRKVNIWPVSAMEDNHLDKEGVIDGIFSKQLLVTPSVELDANEASIPLYKKFIWTSENDTVIARTAYLESGQQKANLVLDIEARVDKVVKLSALTNNTISLNRDLFDVYHWCVNPAIVSIMDQ